MQFFKLLLAGILLNSIFISTQAQLPKNIAFTYTIQKSIECKNGSVVSAHPLASMVGVEILKQGGNAVDAAIATQLALAVVTLVLVILVVVDL